MNRSGKKSSNSPSGKQSFIDKRNTSYLAFVITITGACILILEIVATRILAPYFGNTVYTITSVITTILAALSIGYYLGGKIADRKPSEKLFFGIIASSGLSVLLLQVLSAKVLPAIGYTLSPTEGALITSFLLFFLPAVLLGMLSPFAIKLAIMKHSHMEIGKITGSMFFWSTFGSILGSILTGFFLIPNFGIDRIVNTVGVVLVLLGVVGLLYRNGFRFSGFILVCAGALVAMIAAPNEDSGLLYEGDGVYEKITVYDGIYNQKPARFILQDTNFSGAMYLSTEDLVFDYTKYYELYKFINPKITDALVLGGSASYSIPKALLFEDGRISVDVVDIEPSVMLLGKKYFRVPETNRLQTVIKDGRRYLYDTKKNYDLIYSDVYLNFNSVPVHFTTKEYFQLVKTRLKPEGIFIANFIGSLTDKPPSLLLSEVKTLKQVFPNSYLFAVYSPSVTTVQNFILIGIHSDNTARFLPEDLKGGSDFLKSISTHLVDLRNYPLDRHIVFTDNFAPVEFLTANTIYEEYR